MLRYYNSSVHFFIGLLLLLFGLKLFWLFVGAVGFLAGFQIAKYFLARQPSWIVMMVAVSSGILGIILALVLQKTAIILAGIFCGGVMAVYISAGLLHATPAVNVLGWPFILGGFIGGLFAALFFNGALIMLSSFLGALLIVEPFYEGSAMNQLTLLFLWMIGLLMQSYMEPTG